MTTVRYLMRSIRENKRTAILSVIFVALEVVCECILPFVMAELIDNSGIDWSSLLLYGGGDFDPACHGGTAIGDPIGKLPRTRSGGILRQSARRYIYQDTGLFFFQHR